jgi:hypothetical protein
VLFLHGFLKDFFYRVVENPLEKIGKENFVHEFQIFKNKNFIREFPRNPISDKHLKSHLKINNKKII